MSTPRYIYVLAALALVAHILACVEPAPSSSPSPTPKDMASLDDMGAADLSNAQDMNPTDMGASEMGPQAEPITAPLKTWTWVEFPDSVCGNGQPTGVGVNLSDTSKDVVIFMQGGGACWDVNTCFVLKSAANLESGYTAASFNNEPVRAAAAFDRADPNNPFKDASFVYIPYCTGDLHMGDKVQRYEALGQTRDIHHKGAANMRAFLPRLRATFPDASRVLLTGASAGGYGAQLSYHLVADAFAPAPVHSLSDCGPMVQPYDGRFSEMKPSWNIQTPPGCEGCAQSLPVWLTHITTTYPDARFGLLAYDADQVISVYFKYPLDGTFTNALTRLRREQYDPQPNARYFVVAGTEHVMLGGLKTIKSAQGVALLDWVRAWMEGSAQWTSQAPQ